MSFFSEHGELIVYDDAETTKRLEGMRLAIEPYAGKLAGFTTAQEIAEFLAREGITATPKNSRSCAIAEYVRQGSGVDDIRVTGGGISAATGKTPLDDLYGDYFGKRITGTPDKYVTNYRRITRNTQAMVEFIVRFDLGEYPELEDVK